MRVERGARVAVIRWTYDKGGEDLSKSAQFAAYDGGGLKHGHGGSVLMGKVAIRRGGHRQGSHIGGSGQICGRLNCIGSAKEASTSNACTDHGGKGHVICEGLCSISTWRGGGEEPPEDIKSPGHDGVSWS